MRRRCIFFFFFFSSRRRHTRCSRDWSSDVCSSDLHLKVTGEIGPAVTPTNVATGSSRKLECAPECQPYPCLLCHQDLPVRYLDHIAVVTPSADLKKIGRAHV